MIFLFFAIFFISQVAADPLDDLRQEGLQNLTLLSDAARAKLLDGGDTLNETKLYITHSALIFFTDGLNATLTAQLSVNETAERLTLQAILENRPGSVLTCISNRHDDGYKKISNLFDSFSSTLDKDGSEHDNDFSQMDTTIQLALSQLQNVYDANAANIVTCVELACFQRNLGNAATQYDNLTGNIANMISSLNQFRQDFNTKALRSLYDVRVNIASEEDSALKALNKCL